VILLAVALVIVSHALRDTTGLNPGDEGYLWYCSLRAAEGEIPLRDFCSYDPGRYYWCAAFSQVFGDGLLGLRRSSAVFELLGLLAGLLALTRVIPNRVLLALCGICLTLWMQPVYKLFEPAVAMMAVWFGVRLLERPSGARLLASGIFVGLAAFIGRNLGLYCFLAFACLILYLRFRMRTVDLWKSTGMWAAGIVIGYSPMLAMMAFLPGFASSFIESVVFILIRGGLLNIPLPVPWPWAIDLSGSILGNLGALSTGITFLLLPILLAVSLVFLLLAPKTRIAERHLLVACAFVGLFYCHHPFSRADLPHLSGAIHPILLGVMAATPFLPGRRSVRAVVTTALIVVTLPAALAGVPAFHRFISSAQGYVLADIGDDSIWISRRHGRLVNNVARAIDRELSADDSILILTRDAILYPLLGRKAPVWDPYTLSPHSENVQREMIQDLERNNTQWVLTSIYSVDDREDLSPRESQPILWAYVEREFEPVRAPGLGSARTLLHRK
jgi:hypothetical protein